MKKLILLSLITLTLNSYCAELGIDSDCSDSEESSNKEFTTIGRLIYNKQFEGGAYFVIDKDSDNLGYMISDDSVKKLIRQGETFGFGKYTLKKIEDKKNVGSIRMRTEYQLISYIQMTEEETSSFNIRDLCTIN